MSAAGPGYRQTFVRIDPAGDEAVLVRFGDHIDRKVHRRVQNLAVRLTETASAVSEAADEPAFPWLVEIVPAYASLLVRYNPDDISYRRLLRLLYDLAQQVDDFTGDRPRRLFELPVRYGGDDGPDLAVVAEKTGLATEKVIELHAQPTYVVYMLGFTPGFCYLGDLPSRLKVKRRATPRLTLPAGAVAIGGAQTGIYSLDDSPGGWHWIGRTSFPLWDARRDPPFLLQAGDEVRFVPT